MNRNTRNEQEDNKLTKCYQQFINKIALIHGRSIKAILYRLNNYEQPVKFIEQVLTVSVGTDTLDLIFKE